MPWRTPELRYTQWIGRRSGVALVTPGLETLDYAVGLKGGHDEVEQPEGEQEHGRDDLRYERSAQFAADRLDSSHQQHHDHEAGLAAEYGDGEGQTARHGKKIIRICNCADIGGSNGRAELHPGLLHVETRLLRATDYEIER